MAIVAVNNLQNHRLIILVSGGKLLQALPLAIAFRYYIAEGWVLSWVWRAPSPCLFLLGMIGLSLKGFMLAIDIASTYGFLCCTPDRWSLVKSATRSAGLQWLILALLILPRISCPQKLILMTHTTTVILPWSDWEVYLLTFWLRRGAVFMVKEGPGHPCRRG